MPITPTKVRVVVRLPENRPTTPLSDPPKIEWTTEKADILWKVIERSRTSDNGGTDWKGLAAHLEVPLPYLLYRAHVRFQEDLRGLQDISVTSPVNTHPPSGTFEDFPTYDNSAAPASLTSRNLKRLSESGRLSASARTSTTSIRARLNSLGSHSNTHPKKAASSSTLTLQETPRPGPFANTNPPLISSDDENDSDDEDMLKEEEAERLAEEQAALDQKLKDLQKMMTNEALGLVSANRTRRKSNERSRMFSPRSSVSGSHSVSNASSPQGSIPEIPGSPPSYSQSPVGRHISPATSSPPALSSRNGLGQPHRRYNLVGRSNSEQDSINGSEASSFSDISDASLSGSALESALLSNVRGGHSRFSAFTRSRFGGGRSAIPQ